MASVNKKKKLENSYQVPAGLKAKEEGVKRMSFFTAALRKQEKRDTEKQVNEE